MTNNCKTNSLMSKMKSKNYFNGDGISCAACAWLIEMKIAQLSGVHKISVNATTQRATVSWKDKAVKLSEILAHIEQIGYHALPFKASTAEELNQAQSKAFIRRLGISGILMMQVMMIAIGFPCTLR
eukprot:TRINITY_DN676_c0_g1_i1.p1 TRINITY_DN676_c0_g1~~TRINITY_DN676_c0_g1_i1.p1  ORF type:complete len:127 (+),score=16.78 TRINITY_DN676_c0_g1_i1:834-1214(+)